MNKRIALTCHLCGRDFLRKPWEASRYVRQFCSTDCAYEWRKTPEFKENLYKTTGGNWHPGWSKGLKAKDDPRIRARENNGKWNGGRTITNGYIQMFVPEHPFADDRGRVYEHRLVMEENIGRYLTDEEFVHHINGIKDDNRIENLSLETDKTHRITHAEAVKEMRRLRIENQRLLLLLALIGGSQKLGGEELTCQS